MKKLRLHWTLHPEKDEAWYEGEKERLTEDEVARELDINYRLSVTGRVFEAFTRRKHIINTFPKLNKVFPIHRIWDFGGINAVLYTQVDNYNSKLCIHERVLGDPKGKRSTLADQISTALRDSKDLFDGFEFIDICDPAGSFTDWKGNSPEVDQLREYGIEPRYQGILSLPTVTRKKHGRSLIARDLQKSTSKGDECLVIYESGCPILVEALESSYRYKRDISKNIIKDQIEEEHPTEDVVDCLIYDYLETDGESAVKGKLKPRGGNSHVNKYTGY